MKEFHYRVKTADYWPLQRPLLRAWIVKTLLITSAILPAALLPLGNYWSAAALYCVATSLIGLVIYSSLPKTDQRKPNPWEVTICLSQEGVYRKTGESDASFLWSYFESIKETEKHFVLCRENEWPCLALPKRAIPAGEVEAVDSILQSRIGNSGSTGAQPAIQLENSARFNDCFDQNPSQHYHFTWTDEDFKIIPEHSFKELQEHLETGDLHVAMEGNDGEENAKPKSIALNLPICCIVYYAILTGGMLLISPYQFEAVLFIALVSAIPLATFLFWLWSVNKVRETPEAPFDEMYVKLASDFLHHGSKKFAIRRAVHELDRFFWSDNFIGFEHAGFEAPNIKQVFPVRAFGGRELAINFLCDVDEYRRLAIASKKTHTDDADTPCRSASNPVDV